jgi:type I restriction enzyme M protein
LANGSRCGSQNSEGQIRAAMLDADVVEVMVAMPGQMFFNTKIPAYLWFLAKQKKRKGEVLFIDARKQAAMISREQSELTKKVDWVRQHILDIELGLSQLPKNVNTKKKPAQKPAYW